MKAELFNFRCWITETEPVVLQKSLAGFLSDAEFEVLGFIDHHFRPQGYTALWLLGESHLAIHTYPEEGKAYIELTSCVLAKRQKFQHLLGKKWTIIEQVDA